MPSTGYCLSQFAYNRKHHSSIMMSPIEADLGYQPRSVSDIVLPGRHTSRACSFITYQQSILAEAQDAMAVAQVKWHAAYDANRLHVEFAVGDFVLPDSRQLSLAHTGTRTKRKFAARIECPKSLESTRTCSTYHWVFEFIRGSTSRCCVGTNATTAHLVSHECSSKISLSTSHRWSSHGVGLAPVQGPLTRDVGSRPLGRGD